ncbi:MAG: hypothetical protein IJY12_04160 [Clostridia bacterium]|nr:hypothetical protein [Clostridia bacterium]
MKTLSYIIAIYPDISVMLEALLIGFVIALVGASGYVFLVYSMKDDRTDRIREKYVVRNPWDKLSEREEKESPKNRPSRKIKILLLILIAVLVILILLILAIKFGWLVI